MGHIFSSAEMMGKEISVASGKEVKDKAERFRAIYFIIRADESRFKNYSMI